MSNYKNVRYSDFLIMAKQIEDYYAVKAELGTLKRENEALKRENFGLKEKIKNLEEKLYKRYDDFAGNVVNTHIAKRRRKWQEH